METHIEKIVTTGLFALYSLIYSLILTGCIRANMMGKCISKNPLDLSITQKLASETIPSDIASYPNTIIIYEIQNDQLYLYRLFEPTPKSGSDPVVWVKEITNPDKHRRLFKWFEEIIPQKFRAGIKYFAIVDPKDNFAAIDFQSKRSLKHFCLYVAFDLENYSDVILSPDHTGYNILGYILPVYIMIHEFGHYLTINQDQQDLVEGCPIPKAGSLLHKIQLTSAYEEMNSCSNAEQLAQCKQEFFQAGEFVTKYATRSAEEDAAETFAHFVLTDACPKPGVSGADDKILLFYKDPKMIVIRKAIRGNLKKLAIYPNMSPDDLTKLFTSLQKLKL